MKVNQVWQQNSVFVLFVRSYFMQSPRMRFIFVLFSLLLLLGLGINPQYSYATTPSLTTFETVTSFNTDDLTVNRYIVELKGEPTALFAKRLRPAKQTSVKFDSTNATIQNYTNQLVNRRTAVLRQVEQVLGYQPRIIDTIDMVFYGFVIEASATDMRKIANLPQVESYQIEPVYELLGDVGPAWIGADQVHDGSALGVYAATLLGANLTPPVNSTLQGRGTFALDSATNELTYQISFNESVAANSVSLVDSTNQSTIATLEGDNATVFSGVIALSAAQVSLLENGDITVLVSTAEYPSGAASSPISGYKGEGVVIGVIDTGINSKHPSFAEVGGDGYVHINPLGQGNFIGACDPANEFYNPAFQCNNKLIGAWTFAETAVISNTHNGIYGPEDEDDHGSHTASTAAGNILNQATVHGFEFGAISGVAPHANIIAYDACGFITPDGYSAGCPGGALYNAIGQAISDGVDVLNYSLAGGSDPWNDPFEQLFLLARDYGMIVSASAGNDGPTVSTVSHVSPWVLSTAATSHNRGIHKSLTNISDGSSTLPDILGTGLTASLPSDTAIIDADSLGNPHCEPFDSTQAAAIAGKIVLCERGGDSGRQAKSHEALAAGAVGFILMNDEQSQGSFISETYALPGIQIAHNDGLALRAWLASSSGTPQARISETSFTIADSNADKLASFSSRGPALQQASNIIKPDLAAPGVGILAAIADTNGALPDYNVYSGTSMAAPQVTGAAALLRGLYPNWTAGEIQSALVMTANSAVRSHLDDLPSTPLDRGNGRVVLQDALFAGLVIDEASENFAAAISSQGANASSLNIPSMADTKCVVRCSWSRTFRSTQDTAVEWQFSAESVGLSAEPNRFTIPAGGTQTITFTLDVGSASVGAYVFNRVILSDTAGNLPDTTLSVAALPTMLNLPSKQVIESQNTTHQADITVTAAAFEQVEVQVAGLSKGQAHTFEAPSNGGPFFTVNVPADSARFVVDIRETTAANLDLYIFYDLNANGSYEPTDPLLCMALSPIALEYCGIDDPFPGQYIVHIYNYQASNGIADSVLVNTAVVNANDAKNLTISIPSSHTEAGPLNIGQAFTLANSLVGDSWYGRYSLIDNSSETPTVLATSAIDFHHVGGAAERIAIAAGDQQSATVGSAFSQALTVVISDTAGNPVPNATVNFVAPSSGASATLSSTSVSTDANGKALVQASANNIVGSYKVLAQLGTASVEFNLSNTAASPGPDPQQTIYLPIITR
jgi:subtilisin family serine protease